MRLRIVGPLFYVRGLRRLACTGLVAGAAIYAPASTVAAQVSNAAAPRGTLLIVGGGSQPHDLVVHFVALAGGPGHARIAILPMASEESVESGQEKKAELDSLGAASFVIDVTRAQADADSIVKLINGATGIWFPGGDQVRLVEHLQGSAALRAIHARYKAGAVLGGTSAGAAIMSDSMLSGNQYFPGIPTAVDSGNTPKRIGRHTIEIIPGLGFLHGAIVDQHFITRARENRLLSVILERPSFIGVGIDEGTAVQVNPDGRWQILGKSVAIVIDARHATVTPVSAPRLGAIGLNVSILPAGSTFDPRTGKAKLPSGGK
ncbi:MAG: cyanophycinase [Gemmatimonadaceae bacterium]